MAIDETTSPLAGRSLDETIARIRTAEGEALSAAVAEGIGVTGYPYADSSKPIPLATELTPDQRGVMEAIATRSGLGFLTVRRFRLPDPVQVRRRWLGLDPPGVLETIVEAPVGPGGAKMAMPLWRALRRRDLLATNEKPAPRFVDDPFARLRLAVELTEGFDPPYEVVGDDGVFAERAPVLDPSGEAIAWTRATLARLLAVWCEERIPGSLRLREPPRPEPGFAHHEITGLRRAGAVLTLLLGSLVRSDDAFSLGPQLDWLVPFYGPQAHDLLGALPVERRDAALVRGFRELPFAPIATGMDLLRIFPSRPLADEIARQLGSEDHLEAEGRASVHAQQQAWQALAAELPAGSFSPLDPSRAIDVPPARGADPLPDASPSALRTLAAGDRARAALADVAVFASLAEGDRLAVAAQVAGELGPAFAALPELAGARGLGAIRHVATGYELVLLPGETFELGLTEADVATLLRWFDDSEGASEAQAFVERWLPLTRPTRQVLVGPVAFGRVTLEGPLQRAFEATCGPLRQGAAEAAAFARRAGFSLPTEREWELAARDGENASFLHDAAAACFLGRPTTPTSRAGIGRLDAGEWAFADEGLPAVGDGPVLLRGVYQAYPARQPWDVVQALVALRSAGRPEDSPDLADGFTRFVLRPDAAGRWRFRAHPTARRRTTAGASVVSTRARARPSQGRARTLP